MADREQDKPQNRTVQARLARLSGQGEDGRSGARVLTDKLLDFDSVASMVFVTGGMFGVVLGGLGGADYTESRNVQHYKDAAIIENATHLDRDFSDAVAYNLVNSEYDGGLHLLVQENGRYQLYMQGEDNRWEFVDNPRRASLLIENIADTYERILREYEEDASGQSMADNTAPLSMDFLPQMYTASRLSDVFSEDGAGAMRVVQGTTQDAMAPTALGAELRAQHEIWGNAFSAVESGAYGLEEGQARSIESDDIHQDSLLIGGITGATLAVALSSLLATGLALPSTISAVNRGRRRRKENKKEHRYGR